MHVLALMVCVIINFAHSVSGEGEEVVICDDDYYQNDEKMDEDSIPDDQEPMFAHRSDMWPKGRNDDGSSARTLRVYFIDDVPLKECWRLNGSPDLVSTDYILETANK